MRKSSSLGDLVEPSSERKHTEESDLGELLGESGPRRVISGRRRRVRHGSDASDVDALGGEERAVSLRRRHSLGSFPAVSKPLGEDGASDGLLSSLLRASAFVDDDGAAGAAAGAAETGAGSQREGASGTPAGSASDSPTRGGGDGGEDGGAGAGTPRSSPTGFSVFSPASVSPSGARRDVVATPSMASSVFRVFESRLTQRVLDTLEEAAEPDCEWERRSSLLRELFANLCQPIEDDVKAVLRACGAGPLLPGGDARSDDTHFYYELIADHYLWRGGSAAADDIAVMKRYWTRLWSHELFPPLFAVLFCSWVLRSPLDALGCDDGSSSDDDVDEPPPSTRSVASSDDEGSAVFEISSPAHDTAVATRRRLYYGRVPFTTDSGNRALVLVAGVSRCLWYDIQHASDIFEPLYRLVKRVSLHPTQLSELPVSIRAQMHRLVCRTFMYFESLAMWERGSEDEDTPELERQTPNVVELLRALPRLNDEDVPSSGRSAAGSSVSSGAEDASRSARRVAGPLTDREMARRVDAFLRDMTSVTRQVNNEDALVEFLRGLRAFRGWRLERRTSIKLQDMLYAFSSPGGPIFPTRPVRQAARATMDVLYPAGRRTRATVRFIFRLLHPYYWPSSVGYWVKASVLPSTRRRCGNFCSRAVAVAKCRCFTRRHERGLMFGWAAERLCGGCRRLPLIGPSVAALLHWFGAPGAPRRRGAGASGHGEDERAELLARGGAGGEKED